MHLNKQTNKQQTNQKQTNKPTLLPIGPMSSTAIFKFVTPLGIYDLRAAVEAWIWISQITDHMRTVLYRILYPIRNNNTQYTSNNQND